MKGGQAHRDVLVQVLAGAYVAAMIEGDPQRAAEVIAPVLHGLDPLTAPPEPVLIELVVLWTLCASGEQDVLAGASATIVFGDSGSVVGQPVRVVVAGADDASHDGERVSAGGARVYSMAASRGQR